MRRFMKGASLAFLGSMLALAASASAGNGTGGGHAGWSIDGPGTTSVEKGEKGSRILNYLYEVPGPESTQMWTMAKASEATGSLDVEWDIAGSHGFFEDWIELTAFADGPSGRVTQVLVDTPRTEFDPDATDGPFQFDGRVTLAVTAGYDFGFTVRGANFAAIGRLRGALTVKERD